MKIGTISDLHIEKPKSEEYINSLCRVCATKNIDLLLIAGDISEDAHLTINYIKKLNEKIKALYVPGNHDMWNKTNKLRTEQIYELFIKDEYCSVY